MITHFFTVCCVIPTMRLIFQTCLMVFILGKLVASQSQSSGKFKSPYIYLGIYIPANDISVYILPHVLQYLVLFLIRGLNQTKIIIQQK